MGPTDRLGWFLMLCSAPCRFRLVHPWVLSGSSGWFLKQEKSAVSKVRTEPEPPRGSGGSSASD